MLGLAAAAAAALAILAFTSAQPATPAAVEGIVDSASSQDSTSQYPGIDIRLVGDVTPYRIEVSEYDALPGLLGTHGQPITIWVDAGTTHVLALRVADQTYNGSWMNDPKAKLAGNYVTAASLGVLAIFLAWAVWWIIPHQRKLKT